jgi:hypothetical protein
MCVCVCHIVLDQMVEKAINLRLKNQPNPPHDHPMINQPKALGWVGLICWMHTPSCLCNGGEPEQRK